MSAGKVLGLLSWLAMALVISSAAGGCTSKTGGGGQTGGKTSPGGTTSSGGARAAGGTTSSGGSSASGGTTNSGGTTSNSGSTGAGGVTGSGGLSKSGGTSGSSGVASTGGVTGGVTGSGGVTVATGGANTGGAKTGGAGGGATGGISGSGGVVASGGGTSNDGSIGSGGTGGGSSGTCPSVDFGTWASGKGPADIGKLAVNNFKPHTSDAYSGAGYAWTFAYVASLQFTKLTGDTTNNSYLISKFDCGQTGPNNASGASVDDRAFGDLPLEIFLENQDAKCKSLGMLRADGQWANTADTAITPDARYWSDDMFMIAGLQDFGYRATKDAKYLNRTALTMVSYLQALQQSDGLFWHTKQSKAYWGRENGWFAAGMALLLQDLPSGSSRDTIVAGYKKQMDGLLPLQIASGTDAGAWRQVLDRTDAWAESSCTAMFTYALVTGVKNGWLSGDKYVTAAKNGWTALGNKTDSSGVLSQVCPGTGQATSTDLKSQQDFYINLKPGSNDQHGQAPLLWSAIALLRTDCPSVR
jgi:unsaturated rhamnogalacturonyl hydrolase